MQLVLATCNPHKLREFAELIADHELVGLPAGVEMPEETGETFLENALLKARAAAAGTGGVAIADDSGIVVPALGGEPGIYSARYAGEGSSDHENLQKLIDRLASVTDLSAYYECALALVGPDGSEQVVTGRCSGKLVETPCGSGGFGYDPIFVPDDFDDGRTMAELTAAEKHSISHRGRAARQLVFDLQADQAS